MLSVEAWIAVAGVVVALVAMALLSPPRSGAAAAARCPNSNALPTEASAEQLADSVLCLIAKERRQADLKSLDRNGSLTGVAERHTDVMIKEDCLEHRCRGEDSLEDRIQRSGYPNPGERFAFGEVTGCARTPDAMVDAWMSSRVHRKRILGRPYRDVGIGVGKAKLNVRGCDDGRLRGVYTVIFAWR